MRVRVTRVEVWDVYDAFDLAAPIDVEAFSDSVKDDVLNIQLTECSTDDGRYHYTPFEIVGDIRAVEEVETVF
jgi:hypothetical protein